MAATAARLLGRQTTAIRRQHDLRLDRLRQTDSRQQLQQIHELVLVLAVTGLADVDVHTRDAAVDVCEIEIDLLRFQRFAVAEESTIDDLIDVRDRRIQLRIVPSARDRTEWQLEMFHSDGEIIRRFSLDDFLGICYGLT